MKRAAISLICAVAVLAPPGLPSGAHEGPHRQQLERIEAKIEETKELIREADRQREGLLEEIGAQDRRRRELSGRIEDLKAELEAATERLAQVQEALRLTRGELRIWTRQLSRTREQLEGQQTQLGDRAAVAYRLGPVGLLGMVLESHDVRSLTDRVVFVESVLGADALLVRRIDVTREQLGVQRSEIQGIETELAGRRDEIRQEVRRVQELKAEQEALRAEVEAAIAAREDLLEGVETTKRKYVQAVREMEQESQRIRAIIQSGGSSGSGRYDGIMYWPTDGPIVSGYGWRTHPIFGTRRFHSGVDIDGECGQPIWAGDKGSVVSAGWNGGYGQTIVIDHGDGLSTLYAHQSGFAVSSGQRVSRAQTIGYVGTTGWSTGCHLHFEVRINGEPVDPMPYLT